MSVEWTSSRGIETKVDDDVTKEETVITFEASAEVPPAWVNFLRQRLYVLDLDYTHVEPGRVVVLTTPCAAESVVQLVHSAVECANNYVRKALRNRQATKVQSQFLVTGQ